MDIKIVERLGLINILQMNFLLVLNHQHSEQDQMNLDVWPREKKIQVKSNQFCQKNAIKKHKTAIQDQKAILDNDNDQKKI